MRLRTPGASPPRPPPARPPPTIQSIATSNLRAAAGRTYRRFRRPSHRLPVAPPPWRLPGRRPWR
eukprot:4031904-Pleurochrysis_carterae.AAC.1